MEYCSTVWDPYYEMHSDTLEKVERRAARWVTGRFHNMSSPSAMIQDLGWRDLNQRRADSRLCMLYKISQGLVDIPISQYLKYSRDGGHFQTIYARTKYYEFSFFPRTVAAWNELPSDTLRLQIWQCANRTLSLLIISCPGYTNHYLTPCFYPSLLLTLLSFSFSSPFITNNPCSFLHSRTQPISISLDGRLYTWNLKPEILSMLLYFWTAMVCFFLCFNLCSGFEYCYRYQRFINKLLLLYVLGTTVLHYIIIKDVIVFNVEGFIFIGFCMFT